MGNRSVSNNIKRFLSDKSGETNVSEKKNKEVIDNAQHETTSQSPAL
jgi:hypothetical protein